MLFGSKRREEDEYHRHERHKGIRWSLFKVLMVVILFGISIAYIVYALLPFFDMTYETKNFVEILFIIFQIYYLFSFFTVKSTSGLVFWMATILILDAMCVVFTFYDQLFY